MRADEGQLREDHARTLRVGQILHSCAFNSSRHTGLSQMVSQNSQVGLRKLSGHELHRGQVHLQLSSGMLSEVSQHVVGVFGKRSFSGNQLLGQQLQQRRFSCSVRSHDTHARFGGHFKVNGGIKDKRQSSGSVVAEAHLIELDERLTAIGGGLFAFRKLQGSRGREGEFSLHLDQASVVSVLPRLHVVHSATSGSGGIGIAVLLQEGFSVHVSFGVLSGLALLELAVATAVDLDLLLLNQQDGGCDVHEQIAIVGHQQEGATVSAQTILQPQHGGEIEVIGGLIQEQQISVRKERDSKGDTHAQTTTQVVKRAGHTELVKPEGSQHLLDVVFSKLRSVGAQVVLNHR
mmetsp:Transcript_10474/g.10459  ORF Transcript_10474/g.10459 Transcript_10474/m.10459 type:complete len:348 (-) Transcript_10474:527-1570(-)